MSQEGKGKVEVQMVGEEEEEEEEEGTQREVMTPTRARAAMDKEGNMREGGQRGSECREVWSKGWLR